MSNRANNILAAAAAGSPGTNIARAQQSRWTGVPNEASMRLVEDKIGSMLEGISGATERNAAKQMQLDLQNKLQAVAAKYGSPRSAGSGAVCPPSSVSLGARCAGRASPLPA